MCLIGYMLIGRNETWEGIGCGMLSLHSYLLHDDGALGMFLCFYLSLSAVSLLLLVDMGKGGGIGR